MTEVWFRPRLAPYVTGAVLVTVVVYVVILLAGRAMAVPDYPFAFAALIGGGNLLWNLRGHARKHGIRADAASVVDVHTGVSLRWEAITAIRLEVERVQAQNGAYLARVARLDAGDQSLRFADLGPGRPPRVDGIVNLETAGLLLAIASARSGATALFPSGWTEPASAETTSSTGARRFDVSKIGGLGAVAFKVGPKLFAIVAKVIKSIKLGSVALTVGAYSLIWSWKFALALVGMVLVHECGHAYAMWRSGVPVKGIYMIPYFGGAAVSQGIAKTRARAAYIAINGPIWGMALALGCFAIFAIDSGRHAFIGTLAAWGALINLFNLLPIFPLDGGRILASLAYSSRRGAPLVAASLALGAAVAYFAELDLLFLVGILGLFEFSGRLAASVYRPALALVDRAVSADDHEHFAHHVAFVELGRDAPARIEQRRQVFDQRKAEGDQVPMTFAEATRVLAGYVVVIGVLVAILFLTANIAGSGGPLDFLR